MGTILFTLSIFGFNRFHAVKNGPTNRKLICSNSSMSRQFFQKLFDQKAFKGLRNGQKVTILDKSFE
jgi:hypothetical protein